jgi:hypothetical protein
LSASILDKLTYPILKYEKDGAVDLLVNIMNMMKRVQKISTCMERRKISNAPKTL